MGRISGRDVFVGLGFLFLSPVPVLYLGRDVLTHGPPPDLSVAAALGREYGAALVQHPTIALLMPICWILAVWVVVRDGSL